MKKYLLFGMTLLLLTACGDSKGTTQEPTETNAAQETNTETASTPATPEAVAEEANTGTELSQLEGFIGSMANWASYQSNTSVTESYENEDYPDSEMNMEKHYVADPAQVYMFTSSMGFSNSHLEQYASTMSGGFESMDGGEFYDMEQETVDIILKNGISSRAELLQAVANNTSSVSETNGTYELTLDTVLLEDIFKLMQASLFYNASPNELDESTLDVLGMDSVYHSGTAKVVTDGTNIVSYELTFTLTSDINGSSTFTLTETFDRVNSIEEVEAPEELMMGIGVN